MRRPGVHLEFFEHGPTQRVARQHALDGFFDDSFRMGLAHPSQAGALDTARITAVAIVDLAGLFVARYVNLVGIDDNDVVPVASAKRESALVGRNSEARSAG